MEAQLFNERLRQLSAMTASDQATELWTEDYTELLAQVKADPDADRRTEHAARMRKLLMHQATYLMNEWIRMNRENTMAGPYEHRH